MILEPPGQDLLIRARRGGRLWLSSGAGILVHAATTGIQLPDEVLASFGCVRVRI
jgi:hypothetical protein